MQCFGCGKNMSERQSAYGFYYLCTNCGRKFETTGQRSYNSQKYSSRSDYKK